MKIRRIISLAEAREGRSKNEYYIFNSYDNNRVCSYYW